MYDFLQLTSSSISKKAPRQSLFIPEKAHFIQSVAISLWAW